MSYHSPWKWTDDQFNGFKEALKGVDIQYKVFQMDSKRNTSETHVQEVSRQAKELIDTWKPDLVYANDDAAQAHVVTHYVNTQTPFVFSGVNANPLKYGFLGSTNVTGIMEQEHFLETVHLLKENKNAANRGRCHRPAGYFHLQRSVRPKCTLYRGASLDD